ncbi:MULTISPECIES: S8 family serine peptidase [Microcoleus]|nr:S8 family serine peptidase [Microcoleus asticus]
MTKHLDLVKLIALMELTSGNAEIIVGLIDGPVAVEHRELAGENIRSLPGIKSGNCTQKSSIACKHGTFVAGILFGKRDSSAPAICPKCTLLLRPIFAEIASGTEQIPSATPQELATAIVEIVDAGVHVLNMSLALAQPSFNGQHELKQALDYATRRGVIIVAAAGNQGTIGTSAITRHPWVIPVVASDLQGRPLGLSNLGSSIGRRGISAPGDDITSLTADGEPLALSGTSVAVPFVTGAIALLWSKFPNATAAEIKLAITEAHRQQHTTIVPPLLDAWAMYQVMKKFHS